MASHSSATTRVQAPHATQSSKTQTTQQTRASQNSQPTEATRVTDATRITDATRPTRTATILDALKQRAQAVLNDGSIDAQDRAVIRYALEVNDPWLAELVRCAEKGEAAADTIARLGRDSV